MGGVPHVNHPNFGWAVSVDDLARVERLSLFEIYNGHPQVNNVGGGGVPGSRKCGTGSSPADACSTASP